MLAGEVEAVRAVGIGLSLPADAAFGGDDALLADGGQVFDDVSRSVTPDIADSSIPITN